MSATNRGATRNERDFYATPKSAFAPLLPLLPLDVQYYEPCCGDGRLITWGREQGLHFEGTDIVENDFGRPMDFLRDWTRRDFILTNPPFSLAQEFAQHGLTFAREVMLLLPLSFLGSQARKPWFQAGNAPNAQLVLSERPKFAMHVKCKECGHSEFLPIETMRPKACTKCTSFDIKVSTSDSNEYAWFYWGRRWSGIIHP